MSAKFVFAISDASGETAEKIAQVALRQFRQFPVEIVVHSFVSTVEQIERLVQEAKIMRAAIVFTLLRDDLRDALKKRATKNKLFCLDAVGPIVNAFETWLGKPASPQPQMLHHLDDDYFRRIAAIEFAVQFDDAKDPRGILNADIVLIGVSRTSKTPLSMYMAYSRKLKVANIPLVPEVVVPGQLYQIPKEKVFGLRISREQLVNIRKERLIQLGLNDAAIYADMIRIDQELGHADAVMERVGCEVIDVTNKALEETAAIILETMIRRSNGNH